jgi:transposase
MINYETFCKIHDCYDRQRLTIAQTARTLGLHPETVAKYVRIKQYRRRRGVKRASLLDRYKDQIVRWLESHPYSAQQIFQRLQEQGFSGGATIVKQYVRKVRPARREAFLRLSFAPAECAQVDWGEYGSIGVGSTRRRLSFFVMVFCYSRLMYVEFTVSQTMEHFLSCHEHAFAAAGGVPERIMVDNLRSAVLKRLVGEAPVFNPRYLDYARHAGFTITACNVGKGNEKGRVERGVGYVKANFLNGLQLDEFSAINPAAQVWLDTVANVRMHGETHRKPLELFRESEQAKLRPLNPMPYDVARIENLRASPQFRISVDTNRYSVPAEYASTRLSVKAYPDRILICHDDKLIARHVRSYDRRQDIEDPDHPKELLAQRRNAREQRLLMQFLSLSPQAQAYYEGLQQRRLNARHHVRKILALREIYGIDATARAIADGLAFHAFSSEYIAHLLESRARALPAASPLSLTRRKDLLELQLPEPNLSLYGVHDDEPEAS